MKMMNMNMNMNMHIVLCYYYYCRCDVVLMFLTSIATAAFAAHYRRANCSIKVARSLALSTSLLESD